jgi:excisionase family DNA binding protein
MSKELSAPAKCNSCGGVYIPRLAYSPGEVARALGISKTYAYTLVRSGRIGSIRVGSRWLVPVRNVEIFLKTRDPAASG